MRLGYRCVTRGCRRYSARDVHLPAVLRESFPAILAWYQSFWNVGRFRILLSWALFALNWALSLSAALLLVSLIAPNLPPWSRGVVLLHATFWMLAAGTLPFLLYGWKTRTNRVSWIKHQEKARTIFPAEQMEQIREALGVCGKRPTPYWTLATVFLVFPLQFVGLPLSEGFVLWLTLAMALSLQLAALRYWLFAPERAELDFLCCNFPVREFYAAISAEPRPGFLGAVAAALEALQDCVAAARRN